MCFFSKYSRFAKIIALFIGIFNANESIANENIGTKTAEDVDVSVNNEIKSRVTLPTVTIDEYEKEIKALQKLQRDNARLKLEVEKAKTLQELKKYGSNSTETSHGETPKVWVISVYKTLDGRFKAQVIDQIKGIRVVSIGDEVIPGFFVHKIGPAGVIVRSQENVQFTLLFTPMGAWVA